MFLKNLYIFAIFIIMGAMAANAHAASVDNTLVDLIQKQYNKTNAFEADFDQTLTHKESGAKEKRKGRLLFQKPLLIRWQTASPHEETLVVNSKEIWDYIPEEEISYRYSPNLVKDSRNIIQVLTGQARLTQDFDVKSMGKENGFSKLTLYPKEPTTQMVDAIIWVNDEGYIRRVRINDFYGNANEVILTSFRPVSQIATSQFKFTPPKGVEVEDLIDRKVEERELFK